MVYSQVKLTKNKNKIMKKIKIQDIPFDTTYEGYYWYSNAAKPIVLDNQRLSEAIFTQLPFIVEGNFYNEAQAISINIKHIDGQYLITRADLANLNEANITEQDYLAHDLKGIKAIKLIHYWQESAADDLLEGMTTLIPVWMAFKGFVK
jgi:CRISPR type III-associated protein (TIGR04423 family)